MAGLDGVDIDEAGQHFGHRLHHRAGDRGGRGGAGLAGRQQQDRDAAFDAGFEHAAGVLGEFHRRHDEAVGVGDERPGAEILLAAGDRVEHLQRRRDVLAHGEGRADMLRRAHHAGVERVEVHIERIGNVARHHRPLEEMDVVEPVDDAGGVIDVLQQRLAVFALLDVDQMHRSARRAVMHALALDQHVVPGILAVQGEVAGRLLDRVEHQRARETDAAVGAIGWRRRGSAPRCRRGWRWRSRRFRAASAPPRGCARDRSRPSGLVAAAFEAGADRPDVVGKRSRPHGAPRFAPAGPARTLLARRSRPAFQAPLTCEALHLCRRSRARRGWSTIAPASSRFIARLCNAGIGTA